ncbi:MAG: (Fe-S)-binding protein [Actinomycetaceae bacterium]|nr:(Fe-S)-binding protein [Actinomycetaceae bacterium]
MSPESVRVVALVLAIVATAVAVGAFTRAVVTLVRRVAVGKPDPGRWRPVGKRLWQALVTILSHREFRSRPWVRAAHWAVMMSFPLLFLTLITGYGQLINPSYALPLIGHFAPWEWVVEFFAWAGLFGILWLILVRTRTGHGSPAQARGEDSRDGSPSSMASRFLGSTRWQAYFVEAVILIVVVAVLGLRASEFALMSAAQRSFWHFPLTGWLGTLLLPLSTAALENLITALSLFKILTSMAWLTVVGVVTTMGVAWHRFLAVVSVYARREADGSKALGSLAPLLVEGEPITSEDQAAELDDDAVLGWGTAADLTWKARLDFSTCTECGRCQELCPAWNTGKPLSPKLLMLSLRDHVAAVEATDALPSPTDDGQVCASWPQQAHSGDVLSALTQSGNTDESGVALTAAPLVGEVVSEDALWDCTMCGACVDQCPVDIEHIDLIVNLRRHQVLMESAFPRELARPFRALETKANPYNQPPRKRLEWAKNLDFDVPVIGEDVEDASEVDWLFWVGCTGAYDDRAKKTSAAIAQLLYRAEVSFAVLGNGESCTGDPARRAGNELLFQMLAQQAVETLQEAKVKRIVVSCAHCFNTIANEYPALGGRFEVVHYTQLLNRLVRDGALRLVAPSASQAQAVTYHDPCYLGRHNQVYSAPRELLSAGLGQAPLEMPRHGERAMCCGAGGARAWMEENRGTRIAQARVDEASQAGADVVATACPFCTQMLSSTPATDQPVVIKDVATLMLEAAQRADSDQ